MYTREQLRPLLSLRIRRARPPLRMHRGRVIFDLVHVYKCTWVFENRLILQREDLSIINREDLDY